MPLAAHADWAPPGDRRDPIEVLEAQAATREADLIGIRHTRMLESPFAFLRGAAAVMAMDLAPTPTTGIRVQLCGDAHVRNFGTFATPDRNLAFSINDFDETLPGPWEWDLKRLAASVHVVARQHGFKPTICDDIVRATVREYRTQMRSYASRPVLDVWYDRIDADDVIDHFPKRYRPAIRRTVTKAKRRDHARAVAKLTHSTGGHLRFVENPPLVVHFDQTGTEPDEVHHAFEAYRTSLADDQQVLLDRFRLVDVARRVVGVGSVGTRCWVVLLEAVEGPDHGRLILQIKQAQASVLEPYTDDSTLGHHGRRVVAGQRLMQGPTDLFLGWCHPARSEIRYYVRQLWDHKGRSDLTTMSQTALTHHSALCAWALARAHARSGDAATIAGYVGGSGAFDDALAVFAASYARLNEADHAALQRAVAEGRLPASPDR